MLRQTLVTHSFLHGSLGGRLLVVSRSQAAGLRSSCGRAGPTGSSICFDNPPPATHTHIHERKGWEGSHRGDLQGRGSRRCLYLAQAGKAALMSSAICASHRHPPCTSTALYLGLLCPGHQLLPCGGHGGFSAGTQDPGTSQLPARVFLLLRSHVWAYTFLIHVSGWKKVVLTFPWLHLGLSSFRNGHGDPS